MSLQVLQRIGLCALAVATLASCAPLYAPRLEGRLLDSQTKQPVSDAYVFTHLGVQARFSFEPVSGSTRGRWTTTDGEGRFVFERILVDRWFSYWHTRVEPKPLLFLVDRRYGQMYLHLPKDDSLWTELSFELSPEPISLQDFEDPNDWPSVCRGWDRSACTQMCLIAYQDREFCEHRLP